MRNQICLPALALVLLAGTSLARAQTVDTVIAPAPAPVIIAQQPVVAPATGVVVQPAAVETVETVRTVQSTTRPRRRVVSHPFVRRGPAGTVTITRTTVSERVVPAPVVATPAVQAITQPGYTEVVQGPVYTSTYPAPLYDVVPGAAVAAPPVGAAVVTPVPTYRYVYEPDRILVIDNNTGIAVQAIPRW
jgi:hypothetical protein